MELPVHDKAYRNAVMIRDIKRCKRLYSPKLLQRYFRSVSCRFRTDCHCFYRQHTFFVFSCSSRSQRI